MIDELDKAYLDEVEAMLASTTMKLPTISHLIAMKAHYDDTVERYETRLIKLCNMLEVAKREVLNG